MWIHWPFFPKTWTKGHWPLDDLWPHVCWGHMCDSTQGSLCLSPMTIHQCMWIQWSILQITTYIHVHTYTYIHILVLRTYYILNEWSHSLLLNSVQARQLLNSVQARQKMELMKKHVYQYWNTPEDNVYCTLLPSIILIFETIQVTPDSLLNSR